MYALFFPGLFTLCPISFSGVTWRFIFRSTTTHAPMFRNNVFARWTFNFNGKSTQKWSLPAKRYLSPETLTSVNLPSSRGLQRFQATQWSRLPNMPESSQVTLLFLSSTQFGFQKHGSRCRETRVGWLFTYAIAWWYFYRLQACFHSVYHALLLLSHCFPSQSPPSQPELRRLFSSWFRDVSFSREKIVIGLETFSHDTIPRIENIRKWFIFRMNWFTTCLFNLAVELSSYSSRKY